MKRKVFLTFVAVSCLVASREAGTQESEFTIRWPGNSSHPLISVNADASSVVTIEGSPDLKLWTELLRAHGPASNIPDLEPAGLRQRFYRAQLRDWTEVDDWKNVLAGNVDSFRSPEPQLHLRESRWVKFAIMLDAPYKVVFQHSAHYLFHYDFATARLAEFRNASRAQFDSATLRMEGQRAVLGAVLFPPLASIPEAGIQFVGFDPYPRETVAEWFHTVKAMLGMDASIQVYYLPTFEQRGVALENADWFASQGVPVSSPARWVTSDEIYSAGWALGRLMFVPGNNIATAYRDGLLRADDILLTDEVPAELPPLAGIITQSPATPNSHVALLAKSFEIPFAHGVQPGFAGDTMALSGREVYYRAVNAFEFREVTVEPIAGEIPADLRTEILALKVPAALDIDPKVAVGAISLPTETLTPGDIDRVGGKAANFGTLKQSIPEHSPSPSLALTFDLWDVFMGQELSEGATVKDFVQQQLEGFTWPPNMAELQTTLAEIRKVISDQVDFSPTQKEAILETLSSAGFDPARRIRFRSSTNVEDSDRFSGAGLYDSFSGCLADDLDADDDGPSHCDSSQPKERGVLRALRKVYASFYNDNAYLERLRHRVDDSQAGMAVLVHYSTPDEFELANGVATVEIENHAGGTWNVRTRLVTQAGAVSVANPDGNVRPEEIAVVEFTTGGPYFSVSARSSLVPLGDHVLDWEGEYRELYHLLRTAAFHWQSQAAIQPRLLLDFEYKKSSLEGLSVKQVRVVPVPVQGPEISPYVVATTNRYGVLQGEFGNVVSNHRLKSFWDLTSRSTTRIPPSLTESLVSEVNLKWLRDGQVDQLAGPIAGFPQYQFARESDHSIDRWSFESAMGTHTSRLRLYDPEVFGPTPRRGPVLVTKDYQIQWAVTYPEPQPTVGEEDFAIGETNEDAVWLAPIPVVNAESVLQERRLEHDDSLTVTTSYYWPREPGGTGAGYTAPVIRWEGTTIFGLTSKPMRLTGDYSQTYRPSHHNISEDFVFEPGLEPGMDTSSLAELEALNIRAIVVRRGLPGTPLSVDNETEDSDESDTEDGERAQFIFWGWDGSFRSAK